MRTWQVPTCQLAPADPGFARAARQTPIARFLPVESGHLQIQTFPQQIAASSSMMNISRADIGSNVSIAKVWRVATLLRYVAHCRGQHWPLETTAWWW
jgi:hypothetical protein